MLAAAAAAVVMWTFDAATAVALGNFPPRTIPACVWSILRLNHSMMLVTMSLRVNGSVPFAAPAVEVELPAIHMGGHHSIHSAVPLGSTHVPLGMAMVPLGNKTVALVNTTVPLMTATTSGPFVPPPVGVGLAVAFAFVALPLAVTLTLGDSVRPREGLGLGVRRPPPLMG